MGSQVHDGFPGSRWVPWTWSGTWPELFLIASGVYQGDDALEDGFEGLHEKLTDSEEPAEQADDKVSPYSWKLPTSDGRAQG